MTIPPSTRSILVFVTDNKPAKSQSTMTTIAAWWSLRWRALIAEFVATMLLVVFGCMACIPIDGFDIVTPIYAPMAFGMIVMINVQVFGHLSGAFMNPFVTIIACVFGKIPISVAIAYVIIESIAAVVGYGILLTISPYDLVEQGICVTAPHMNLNEYQALGVEILLSVLLSLMSCALWDPQYSKNQDSAAIKFGLTILGLSLAGAPLTGASMNPARSLGPAVWTGSWRAHWVYWAGPLIGGILPGVFYKYVWLQQTDDQIDTNDQKPIEAKNE